MQRLLLSLAGLLGFLASACGSSPPSDPPEGEESIALTIVEPKSGAYVNTAQPLVSLQFDGVGVHPDSLSVEVDGYEVDTRSWVVLGTGASGRLPDLSEEAHVLSATILGDDGAGSTRSADFTVSTGGASTVVRGQLLDPAGDIPIEGARVFLDEEPDNVASVGPEGWYEIRPQTDSTAAHVVFDPRDLNPVDETGQPYGYPLYKRPIQLVPGATLVNEPCYLPKVYPLVTFGELAQQGIFDCANQVFLEDYELRNEEIGVGVLITRDTRVTLPDAIPACESYLSIAPVDPDKAPSNFPPEVEPAELVTVQPTGMRFWDLAGEPKQLPIFFPNSEGLALGNEFPLFSVDHDTGNFVEMGLMRVDPSDPSRIITFEGGLEGGSWHLRALLRILVKAAQELTDCGRLISVITNPTVDTQTGFVKETYELPRRQLFDEPYGLDLVYDSGTVVPRIMGRVETAVELRMAVPRRVSVEGYLGTLPLPEVWVDTSAFREDEDTPLTLPYPFDVSELSNGVYPYSLLVRNHYRSSSFGAVTRGALPVVRRQDGPFGRGWQLEVEQRLHRASDGSLMLERGAGGAIVMPPALGTPEVETEGGIEFFERAPASLGNGDSRNEEKIQVYAEQINFALVQDLDVDSVELGVDIQAGQQMVSGVIPRGTPVDAYILHQDTAARRFLQGTITFPVPVLGVIARRSTLAASDGQLGLQGTEYVNHRGRGLEFSSDSFAVSADGLSVTLRADDGIAFDQIRIITLPTEPDVVGYQLPEGDSSQFREKPDGSFERVFADGTRDEFDALGYFLQSSDLLGRTTRVRRDAQHRIQEVIDPVGGVTTFYYQGGHVVEIRDPAGRTTRLAYDGVDLVRITDVVGEDRVFGYDPSGLMVLSTDADGIQNHHEYDDYGRFLKTTYPDGSTREIQSVHGQILAQFTEGLGLSEDRPLDPTRTTGLASRIADELDQQMEQRLEPVSDGGFTRVVTSQSLPAGKVRCAESRLDPDSGRLLEITLFEGEEDSPDRISGTTYLWDTDRGLLLERTEHDYLQGGTRRFRYEWHPEYAWLEAVVEGADSPDEMRTEYLLDEETGALLEVTRPLPAGGVARTRYARGPLGVLETLTLPSGQTISYERQPATQSVQVVRDTGGTIRYERDLAGAVRSVQRGSQAVQTYLRDDLGRILSIQHGDGASTDYAYGPQGRLDFVRDAKTPAGAMAPVHRFAYDERGRLKEWTDPIGRSRRIAYTPTGLVQRLEGFGARVEEHTYDELDRRVRTDYRESPEGPVLYSSQYGYGPLDTLVRVADEEGEILSTFDGFGQQTGVTHRVEGVAVSSIETTYDALGYPRSMSARFQGDLVLQEDYTYLAGELVELESSAVGEVLFGYADPMGRRTSLVRGEVMTSYAYDPRTGRLGATETTRGTQRVSGDWITSLGDDLTLRRVASERSLADPPLRELGFSYDSRGRLTVVDSVDDERFAVLYGPYDAVGNRRIDAYEYDQLDRLRRDGTNLLTYDEQGCLEQIVGPGFERTFGYDVLGRLRTVVQNGELLVEYRYDPLGRRISSFNGQASTQFVYNGEDVLLLARNGQLDRIVTHGPWEEEPLMVSVPSSFEDPLILVHDLQGNVVQCLDGDGVCGEYAYDPFGNLLFQDGSEPLGVHVPFGFQGRRFEPETGFYDNRARDYLPAYGRFTSEEPLLPALLLTGHTNPYAYALNDPLQMTDRDGREPVILVGLGLAVAGIFAADSKITGSDVSGAAVSCALPSLPVGKIVKAAGQPAKKLLGRFRKHFKKDSGKKAFLGCVLLGASVLPGAVDDESLGELLLQVQSAVHQAYRCREERSKNKLDPPPTKPNPSGPIPPRPRKKRKQILPGGKV